MRKVWLTVLGFTFFYAVNLFFFTSWIQNHQGEGPAMIYSLLSRLLATFVFGAMCQFYCERTRLQSMSLGAFLEFLDQAILKGIWLSNDRKLHPDLWKDIPASNVALGTLMGYFMFLPIIVVVTFLGWEFGAKFFSGSNKK